MLLIPNNPPCRTFDALADKLDEDYYRTPNGPRGSDPDPREPDDPDNNNASDLSIKDNPLLMLTNTITCLSCTTRCRPEDSVTACTKVHEPDTFDGMDPKNLHDFLIQCELNFHNRLQAFCLYMQKVGFSLSFLKGIALAWFEPDLLNAIPSTEPT
ncbi:hypothetical protein ID866_9894 [Astraeus odoratus]|nr:hypothetical protein ID866_9894 [Astraeus odoratus]